MGDDHLCVAARDENGFGGLGYPCLSGEVLCQDSLVCFASSPDDAACHQLCSSGAECAPGDACMELTSSDGVCLVRGSSSEGDECVEDLDCNSEDLLCLIDDNDGGAHCYIQCGMTSGCPSDYECTPLGSGTSYCAPPDPLPDVDAGPTLDAGEVDAGGAGSTGNTANDGGSPDTPVDSGMSDDNGAETGGVRGPCYGNGTCNAGLTCISEVCVEEQTTCRCVGTPSTGTSGLLCFIGVLMLSQRRRRQE